MIYIDYDLAFTVQLRVAEESTRVRAAVVDERAAEPRWYRHDPAGAPQAQGITYSCMHVPYGFTEISILHLRAA